MGKTYEELLGVTAERFSSVESLTSRLEDADIKALIRTAILIGDLRLLKDIDVMDKGDYFQKQLAARLGEEGVKGVVRGVVAYGFFDGEETLRCLPWVSGHSTHWSTFEDVAREADDMKMDWDSYTEDLSLIAGYLVHTRDGVNQVIYDAAGVKLSERNVVLLKDVSSRISGIEHLVKIDETQPIPLDSL